MTGQRQLWLFLSLCDRRRLGCDCEAIVHIACAIPTSTGLHSGHAFGLPMSANVCGIFCVSFVNYAGWAMNLAWMHIESNRKSLNCIGDLRTVQCLLKWLQLAFPVARYVQIKRIINKQGSNITARLTSQRRDLGCLLLGRHLIDIFRWIQLTAYLIRD